MTTIFGASSPIASTPSQRKKQPHQSWLSLLLIGLTTLSPTTSALAQPIAPANDGTGTLIAPHGNQFDISGGTQAGGNLFHSFQQFGLGTNQIANFLATPDLQNILGRVVGGDPSIINGIIQVTGGTPNLYLLNPAGIVFGQNASLNVPASFTATTATGIGFGVLGDTEVGGWGDGGIRGWFHAYETSNYATLIGNPTAFQFPSFPHPITPSSLVNAGTLTVKPGQSLNLIGGTVINTGTLTAPGGSITVLSVPNSSLVRLSQPGSLLSLEIDRSRLPNDQSSVTPSVATLPQLLTGSGLSPEATGLSVGADGTVRLVATNTVIPQTAGTTIVSGTINTSTIPTPDTPHSTPYIAVLGDRVALLAANLTANGTHGGGTILIGGDYQGKGQIPNAQFTTADATTTLSANALQSGNGGKIILWADNTTDFYGSIYARGGSVSGDGGFAEVSGKQVLTFQGTTNLSATSGSGGLLLLDPADVIIDNSGAHGTFSEAAIEGLPGDSLVSITATNSITIGTLADGRLTFQRGSGDIIFNADSDGDGVGTFTMNLADSIFAASPLSAFSGRTLSIIAGVGGITVGNLRLSSGIPAPGGNAILRASGDITTNSIRTNADSDVVTPTPNQFNGGNISITSTGGRIDSSGSLVSNSAEGNAGNITLIAYGDVFAGAFATNPVAGGQVPGKLTIRSQTGSVDISRVTSDPLGVGGVSKDVVTGNDVVIESENNITTGSIFNGLGNTTIRSVNGSLQINGILSTTITDGNAGSITLEATNKDINITANIVTFSVNGRGGEVKLTAGENIAILGNPTGGGGNTAVAIETFGLTGSGNITLSSTNGSIDTTGGNLNSNGRGGNAGNIRLEAQGDISTVDILSLVQFDFTDKAGDVTLISRAGSINTSFTTAGNAGIIDASSANGSGGAVILSAAQSVITRLITTNGGAGSGLITLDGAEINLVGDAGSIQSQGNPLVIQPKTASQNLVLGGAEGTDANTLYFSTTDLTALATTFSGLTFGRSDGTGTVTVDSSGITLNSPSVIQTGSGSILLNGNISTPSQPLTVTGAMQLGNDVTLTTAATGAGNTLTLNGNLAGQNRLLNLATGSSTLVVNGLLGSESPLSSIGLTTASLLLNGGINTNATLAPTVPITLTGNIALTSQTGNVDLRNAPITSQTAGSGVTVTSQQGNILAGNISTATATTGGAINLLAPNGSVTARNLNTSGQTGGAVFVQASDNNLNPDGAVGLFSTPSILLGEVNTSGSVGNGGNVTLDPLNAVEVSFINAQGGPNGVGGNVTITTSGSFFIARGTFLDQNGLNASISTAGGLGGGNITITHNGGDLFFPFNTALADTTIFGSFPSGTAGVLTVGSASDPTNVIQNQAFPGSYTQVGGSGTIRIITSNRFETAILNSLPDGIEPENLLTIDAERPFPIEEYFTREFEAYFAEAFGITPSFDTPIKSLEQIQDELSQVERATGIKPAILYIAFFPQGQTGRILAPISEVQLLKRLEDPTDQLDLVLVTSNHPPIYRRVPEATREKVSTLISEFRQNYVISPSGRKSTDYLPNVQQFYQWLVAPIQTDLQALKIQNLTFITDVKLRSLPIATLHDGKDFIIRTYSVGFMPSMSLTNTQYADIKNSHVLAMGASDFSLSGLFLSAKGEAKARSPLPAVPLELELITTVWQGAMFLNEQFTREALERERRNPAYRIIHLATHAQFEPEKEPTDHAQFEPQRKRREMLNSFIQLWAKERLLLDQLRELRWYDPVVEMLVLSACETAVGDRNAELGFIGLATQAGVKTAVGSFWTVDDAGSSALMSEFYWQLKLPDVPIKAEAIRRAQLAMIEGRVRLENGQLVYSGGRVSLPPAIEASTVDFSHPYFWSAFTTVGSPW